jgi:hypothetical protein
MVGGSVSEPFGASNSLSPDQLRKKFLCIFEQ